MEQVPDGLAEVGVVGLLLEPERPHVVVVRRELGWTSVNYFSDRYIILDYLDIYLVMYLQGESKKSVISKNENWPWWEFFEKKIHDQ